MAESFILYKLIILYLLSKASGPVPASYISDFVLGMDYTDYFTLQQSLSELEDTNLVLTEQTTNATLLSITKSGQDTLSHYAERVSESIRTDVANFLREHEMEIREDVTSVCEYHRTESGKFAVHCRLKEENEPLVDLTLSCRSKEQAEAICTQWKAKSFDVYALLMDELLQ